jgi:CheY-like chemotaxis protein
MDPNRGQAPAPTEHGARQDAPGRSGRSVVLVVEDDADIRFTLCESLDESGYAAVGVSDGEEAFQALRDGLDPDLVVLDLMMPRMDGWLFLEKLRASPRHRGLPVLVASAAPDDHPPRASGWLPKPFHIDEFDRAVARLCRR